MQPTIYPLFSAPVYYVPDTNFRVDDHTLAKFLDRTEFPDWTDGTGLTSNQFILNDSTYKDILVNGIHIPFEYLCKLNRLK